MAFSLDIYVEELSDATGFRIYDRSDWTELVSFDHTLLTSAVLTVTYDDTDYTLTLVDTGEGIDLIGLEATFDNIFGASYNSYYEVAPADLLDDESEALDDTYFTDGYYEVKLEITYDTTDYDDTDYQGFLAENECKAAQLPLRLNFDDFDYQENRLTFLVWMLLYAAKRAAARGRQTQFERFVDKLNDFYTARDISECW